MEMLQQWYAAKRSSADRPGSANLKNGFRLGSRPIAGNGQLCPSEGVTGMIFLPSRLAPEWNFTARQPSLTVCCDEIPHLVHALHIEALAEGFGKRKGEIQPDDE